MERRGDKCIKIQLKNDVKALLFVDDQLIVTDSEDALQISIHKLLRPNVE